MVGRPFLSRLRLDLHLPTVAAALILGATGGWLCRIAGLPLPWLLGALVVTSAAALAGWEPFGRPLGVPPVFRLVAIPIIGTAIGGAFTPEVASAFGRWWPSLLALVLYVPLAHLVSARIARRLGRIDRTTAFYGTMPGGFVEAIQMGEAARADLPMLMVMQFLRLILCIVAIPLAFSVVTGHAVGSAAGAELGSGAALSAETWALLGATAAAGAALGCLLRLPAWIITGPIVASAAVHLAGWVDGTFPGWLISAVQVFVGAALGARFAGRSPALIWQALRITAVTVAATLAIAAAFAAALHGLAGESWQAVFLAFAPGGVTEMSLVALSLDISVIYVTLHHVVRILLTVTFARLAAPPPEAPPA